MVWIICGLLWCFYQLFGLSFWWHPFTAEDPLVSKWWNATFIWWRNKLIYILDDLTVSTFSTNVYRRVNYSFQSEFKRKTSISLLKCKLIFAVNLKYLHLHLQMLSFKVTHVACCTLVQFMHSLGIESATLALLALATPRSWIWILENACSDKLYTLNTMQIAGYQHLPNA